MVEAKGDLSQNQDQTSEAALPQLADAYSFAAPMLLPLNQELRASEPPLKLHVTASAAMAGSLQQNLAILAPCPIFSLLGARPFMPAAAVGLSFLGRSPSCFFGLREAHPRLTAFINSRLRWLKATYEAKAKQQLASPREAIQQLWTSASENDPIAELQGMQPKLVLRSQTADQRDMATAFYRLIFGSSAADQQLIIEAAGVQPIAGQGEVAIEFHWLSSCAQHGGQANSTSFKQVFELGELWQQITALPFVLALWQRNGPAQPQLNAKLRRAAQLAETKMKIEPSAYFGEASPNTRNIQQLTQLWRQTRYLLNSDDFLGLQLLGQLLQLSRQKPDYDFYLRASRWNDELASQQGPLSS